MEFNQFDQVNHISKTNKQLLQSWIEMVVGGDHLLS